MAKWEVPYYEVWRGFSIVEVPDELDDDDQRIAAEESANYDLNRMGGKVLERQPPEYYDIHEKDQMEGRKIG